MSEIVKKTNKKKNPAILYIAIELYCILFECVMSIIWE